MRKELRKAAFAILVFAVLMIAGFQAVPAAPHSIASVPVTAAGEKCANTVAEQAATTHVVMGAWDCIGGDFLAEMQANGINDAVSFAENGPGSDPPKTVKFIATIDGNAYLYEIGTAVWKFTVVDGKVVAYK